MPEMRHKNLLILVAGAVVVVAAVGIFAWRFYAAKQLPTEQDQRQAQLDAMRAQLDQMGVKPLTQAEMQAKLNAASSTRPKPLTQAQMQAQLDALRKQQSSQ